MSIETEDWGYDTHVAISWVTAANQEWPYGSEMDVDKRRIAVRYSTGLVRVWTFQKLWGSNWGWEWMSKDESSFDGQESGYSFDSDIEEYAELADSYEGYSSHEIEEILTPDDARYDYRIQESDEIDGEVAVYSQKFDTFTGEDIGEPRIYFKLKNKREKPSSPVAVQLLKKWGLTIIGR